MTRLFRTFLFSFCLRPLWSEVFLAFSIANRKRYHLNSSKEILRFDRPSSPSKWACPLTSLASFFFVLVEMDCCQEINVTTDSTNIIKNRKSICCNANRRVAIQNGAYPVSRSVYYPKFLDRDTKARDTYRKEIKKSKSYRDDIRGIWITTESRKLEI